MSHNKLLPLFKSHPHRLSHYSTTNLSLLLLSKSAPKTTKCFPVAISEASTKRYHTSGTTKTISLNLQRTSIPPPAAPHKNLTQFRSYTITHDLPEDATAFANDPVITKKQLLDLIVQGKCRGDEPQVLLLDVRKPEEFANGSIPDAKNLPLNDLDRALTQMNPQQRKEQYGFDINQWKDGEMVVYCQAGLRSRKAQLMLEKEGFENVSNYEGSYGEWSSTV